MTTAIWFVVGVAVIFGVGALMRFGARKYADTKVAVVMLAVEKQLSTWAKDQLSSGADKREEAIQRVTDCVYPFLPLPVKLFVTEDMLVRAIDKLYSQMLDYLDDGLMNQSE